MKRNLLLLAVMIWVAFGFSLAYGVQDPNDNGVADTMYLEVWQGDDSLFMPGPWDVAYNVWVTNDIPSPVIDSIAGMVIPLCFTYTNGAANVTIDPAKNKCGAGDLEPFPNLDASVFRHMPDMATNTFSNWMMEYSEAFMGLEWGTRIIDISLGNNAWFSLVPTGTTNQRFKGGSRVLTLTVTFTIEDSTNICLDTCFWPPTGRLAFSRSDATTYMPIIWDEYAGTEYYCVEHFIVPNIPPTATCPGNQSHAINGGVTITPAVTGNDLDGVINSATIAFAGAGVSGEALVNAAGLGTADYTADVSYNVDNHCLAGGTMTVTLTDDGGATGVCTFDIALTNEAPVVTCPGDASVAYNAGFTGLATATDANGDAVTFGGDAATDGSISFTYDCGDLGDNDYNVTATDVCGASDDCDFTVTVTNAAPSVDCPNDFTETSGSTVELTEGVDYSMSDPEGGPLLKDFYFDRAIDGTAGFTNGTFEWTTTANDTGVFELCFEIEDECGLTAECCFNVTLVSYGFSDVGFPPVCGGRNGCCLPCFNPGQFVKFPIMLNNETTPFGGFELAIEFDYTSMTFVSAELAYQGTDAYGCQGIVPLDFEKFTYRLLPCPLCGCCKYKILLYGQYDVPDGVEGTPIPMLEGALVYLNFVINNNENLRGLMIPICFEWEGELGWIYDYPDLGDSTWGVVNDWNCGENTFSSKSGDTLYVDQLPCRFWGDACDDAPGDRIQPVLTFAGHNCGENCGGIMVCDATPSTCKRGDVNYNTLTYEVADAVLFASYFVKGTPVFRYDLAYQICATDVNADGRTLTLSDLVYLIRVILQDAVEMPKLTPSTDIANVVVYNGTISTECASPIGAILFEFDSAVDPTLLADMEMVHNGNKVLVWSSNGNTFSNAEVLSADAELVSATAVDRDSRELETTITAKVAPGSFALHRAYPNPFNPFTNLSFNLPEAMNYSLRIYNVAGQLVRTLDGVGSQNLNVVTWDGMDNSGSEVSSGVYFYKLTAAGFSATEKMVMMK